MPERQMHVTRRVTFFVNINESNPINKNIIIFPISLFVYLSEINLTNKHTEPNINKIKYTILLLSSPKPLQITFKYKNIRKNVLLVNLIFFITNHHNYFHNIDSYNILPIFLQLILHHNWPL